MALHDQIQESIKDAMKSKDEVCLSVMRGLIAAFTNELVATKRKPDGKLSDEEALSVIRREAKKRTESIEQFEKGHRGDLAKRESEELKIIEEYLPEMMSKDEIRKIVEAKKEELGIDDVSKKGMLMGAVMKELKGSAEGGDVKEVVDEILG